MDKQYAVEERRRANEVLETAKKVVISSQNEADLAKDQLDAVKALAKQVEASRKDQTVPLNNTLKDINASYKTAINFLADAESIIKKAIINYLDAEENKRKLAQAKEAEEAEKKRQALLEKAEKAQSRGKQQVAEALEEVSLTVVPTVVEAPKVQGLSVRKIYRGVVTDKAAVVKAALDRPDIMALLEINESKLNKLASALKENLFIPGVEVVTESKAASRSNTKVAAAGSPF